MWATFGRTGSVAGPEIQPNIGCWPRGPAKVCRPKNEAAVNQIYILYMMEEHEKKIHCPIKSGDLVI